MRNDTIRGIADQAGVSVSTVSRVLNQHPDVSEKTRKKVETVIYSTGYVPNNSARNLRKGPRNAIGVIIKGISNPFFSSMLNTIQEQLKKNNYLMFVRQVGEEDSEVDAAISLCIDKKPRGLIFMGGRFQQSSAKLSQIDIPFVTLTVSLQLDSGQALYSSVSIDDYHEMSLIAMQVIQAGHRKLAVIGSYEDDASVSNLRINGLLAAAKKAGVSPEQIPIAYAGGYSLSDGYAAAQRLSTGHHFSCLFCVSDILAIGALRGLHDNGFAVPGEISVLGFDGIEEGGYTIPTLATVCQPRTDMAHKGVELLLAQLYGSPQPQHILYHADFLERESFQRFVQTN